MPPKDTNPPPLPTPVPYNFPEANWNSTDATAVADPSSSNATSIYTRFFIISVVCLCFVASLVLFLHLYLRYIRHRNVQRHHRQTVNLLRLTTFTHTHSDFPRAGLDQAAISSIPSFQYQKEARASENSTATAAGADCAVCLSLLEEGEVIRMLPACCHIFHVACIDKWLTSSASCPVCRAEVRAHAQVQARSQPAVVEVIGASAQERSGSNAGSSVSTRLSSSFRKMLSGDRSSRRVQDDAAVMGDLERGNGSNSNN